TTSEDPQKKHFFNHINDNLCKDIKINPLQRFHHPKCPLGQSFASTARLTLCKEGYNGEHATSVNGTGHPRLSDFIAVGKKIRLSEDRCWELIEEVLSGCAELSRYDIKE
ncbi:MAG: HipA domain-containing protein, partial [Bacteroidales bacterium]|nr:HipA domain-containing protein [Bacteroidales bacterium]